MKLKYLFIIFVSFYAFKMNAQTPGVSIFYEQFSGDTREYIEYIPGNLPIIISAPHGGVKQSGLTIGGTNYPDNDSTLPDRSCGTNERDDNTDILIREIQAEIFALTGCYAHVIINNLHRSKLDPNRAAPEATCGNSNALDHWNAWHSFIDQASTSVETNWGKGLYIDLHGQSHTVPRIEIGYNILSAELNTGNLNSAANITRSTINNLVTNNLNGHTHEELIRGDNSLGQLFQEQPAVFYNANVNPGCGVTSGYRAVPSNSNYGSNTCDDTRPFSNAYFNGDFYNNRRHGSGNGSGTNAGSNDGGGNVDGIMTEVNRRVRDLGTYNGNVYDTRPQTLVPFAKEYAVVVLDYIDIHYNDFASFSYASNSYDLVDSDPLPTVLGLSGGMFSSTSGLSINGTTGLIDISNSLVGNYVVTYTVGSCGYYKDTFNISITGPDTIDPSVPTNLLANNVAFTTADLSWTASTDNVGVTGYDIYQDGIFLINVVGTSHQVTGLTESTNYSFYVIAKDAANNSSGQSNTVNITTATPVPCTGPSISSFPYSESFENTFGLWTQDATDDFDWTNKQEEGDGNSTPSADTGPSLASDGNYFLFIEASNPNFPSKIARLISPCLDFTGRENAALSFDYHMFGGFIGELTVDVSIDNGVTYSTLTDNTLTGSQQNSHVEAWKTQNVDLSLYDGQSVKLRFTATTSSDGSTGWQGDISIDNFGITSDAAGSAAPVAACQNINVQLDASGNASIVALDVDGGSTDDVAITNYSIDIDTFSCSNIGTPVDVTLTVTDGDNQTDTCVATVTVLDQIDPEFVNVPTNITLTCGNNQPTWADPTVTDNCATGLAPTRTDVTGLNSGDIFPSGTTTISYGVNDGNGNTNTASFTVNIVVDSEIPNAVCQNITVQLDGTGNAVITAAEINNNSTDNCGISTITASQTTFTCADEGANNVTLTVTDTNGNVDTCIAVVTITLQDEPTVECWETTSFNTGTCLWEVSGTQPVEPTATNCWDDYQFNTTTCAWENQGTEPVEPTVTNCWDNYQFNTTTCAWENQGTEPVEPTGLECWETTSFNNTTCLWEVSGTEPVEPTATNCWDNYQFNTTTCTWENQGTEPVEPTGLECWETTSFNTGTCLWEVSGTQPVEPTATNCWDNYQFNNTTCTWENQGTEPVEPTGLECWETTSFNTGTCLWEVSGTQPVEPTATNCWDNYQFNTTTCIWENQGSEPTAPIGLTAVSITITGATINWDAIPSLDFDLRYRQLGSPFWTDILDLSTNSQALTALTALTQYEVEVRSKCSVTEFSNYSSAITFTTLDNTSNYCPSASTNVNDEFISRVELNTIDNTSADQFYSDFTDISTVVRKGTQYTITITPTWTGTVYNEAYSVWIDYNNDKDFDDAGEQVYTQAPTQNTTVSGVFTIPTSAVETKTRMRVSMKWNDVPDPCETFTYGEVEDYTIVVVGSGDLIYKDNAWTPNAPSSATNTDNAFVIDGTYTVTDDIQINNMTVCDGAGIVIEKVKSLTVNGTLKTSDNVVLESDSNEYASLIVNNLVVGTVQYKRHVNGTATTGGNDLIAPPVYGEQFDDFRLNNPNILSNTANTLFLFGPFDKVTDTYMLYTDTETASLNAGIGYRAASTDASTFTFTGLVKMGNMSTPVVISGPTNPEWNLIGNPYPSYIKLSDFLSVNNSKFDSQRSGIYGYDGNALNGWTIWNQAYSDANPNAKITPGQGFLIASASNQTQIDFTSTMRSIGSDDDFIVGRQSSDVPISHLKLKLDNTSNFYQTDFYFTENASLGLDPNYDSGLFDTAPALAIYSRLVEDNIGRNYGVQSIGSTNLSDVVIPLGIHISEGQQASISITETTLPQDVEVYLEDNLTNTFTLLNTSDYVFTANANLTGTGRFFLSFAQSTLGTNVNESNNIEIFTTTQPQLIHIKGQLFEDTKMTMYDIQGRLVKTVILDESLVVNKIDVSLISNGVYIVTVKNNNQEKTQKVIISD